MQLTMGMINCWKTTEVPLKSSLEKNCKKFFSNDFMEKFYNYLLICRLGSVGFSMSFMGGKG